VLGRALLLSRHLRVDPNVAIGAQDARDRRYLEEVMDVALHASDQVVVDLHQHPIAKLAVLLSASMQLNFAVKGANLLHLSRDKVTFDVVVADVKLVLLNTSTLDATREVDRGQV